MTKKPKRSDPYGKGYSAGYMAGLRSAVGVLSNHIDVAIKLADCIVADEVRAKINSLPVSLGGQEEEETNE